MIGGALFCALFGHHWIVRRSDGGTIHLLLCTRCPAVKR